MTDRRWLGLGDETIVALSPQEITNPAVEIFYTRTPMGLFRRNNLELTI